MIELSGIVVGCGPPAEKPKVVTVIPISSVEDEFVDITVGVTVVESVTPAITTVDNERKAQMLRITRTLRKKKTEVQMRS